jgi:hypothetical protein
MAHQIARFSKTSLLERIDQNLDRIAHSLRGKRTDVGSKRRMELVLAKIETYIECRRPPMTIEKAMRRAMTVKGIRLKRNGMSRR